METDKVKVLEQNYDYWIDDDEDEVEEYMIQDGGAEI